MPFIREKIKKQFNPAVHNESTEKRMQYGVIVECGVRRARGPSARRGARRRVREVRVPAQLGGEWRSVAEIDRRRGYPLRTVSALLSLQID